MSGETSISNDDQVQGEGDYKAARRYDKAAQDFAESGKVQPAAHEAAPGSDAEARELEQAEAAGKAHSKGEDRKPTTEGKA